MPRRIPGPDGRIHTFPDDATDAEIDAAVAQLDDAPEAKSGPDYVSRGLKLLPVAGGVVGGLAGMGAGPVGAVGLGTLLASGGEAWRQNIERMRGKGGPETPRGAVQGILEKGIDYGAFPEMTGQLISAVGRGVAPNLAGRALKPKAGVERRDPAVPEHWLQENVPLTTRGADKLQTRNDAAEALIDQAVGRGVNVGKTVSARAVASRVDPLMAPVAQNKLSFRAQGTPTKDVADIQAVKDEFLREHGAVDAMPIAEVQAIKRGTGRNLPRAAYEGMTAAQVEAKKGLIRGMKEEIASELPEIAIPNARLSRLIPVQEAQSDALRRIGHRDPVGLSDLLAAASGKPLSVLAAVANRPYAQGQIARGAFQLGKRPSLSSNTVRTAIMALLASQENDAR